MERLAGVRRPAAEEESHTRVAKEEENHRKEEEESRTPEARVKETHRKEEDGKEEERCVGRV